MRTIFAESDLILNFEITEHLNIEDLWKLLKHKLLNLRERFVPAVVNRSIPNWKYDFPLSESLKNVIREKNQAYHKWIAHRFRANSVTFKLGYVKLRNRWKQMSRREK